MHLVKVYTRFSAALRLGRQGRSAEEESAIYGACAGLHGHDFEVEVAVAGPIDPQTGMVIDFLKLHAALREEVHNRFDHKYLNDIDVLAGQIPTSENLSAIIWSLLEARLGAELIWSVSVSDRDGNSVTFFGPHVRTRSDLILTTGAIAPLAER